MFLEIDESLLERFPGFTVLMEKVNDLTVVHSNESLEEFKESVFGNVPNKYSLESLKDVPVFRVYRDFFWRVGIDPTKVRPAAEALIRRLLAGKQLSKINTFVDAYNLASINSEIALAAFDAVGIEGSLIMRSGIKGEEFLGIGMKKPLFLKGNEVVITDDSKLVAVYPYRDADSTKITLDTREAIVLSCGVPGIELDKLNNASQLANEYISRFCIQV